MDRAGVRQLFLLAAVAILACLWLKRKLQPVKKTARVNRPALDVLYPGPADETAEVDIIAVHGLGASVDWSWTWTDKAQPSRHVHWLKDAEMLPAVVPKARIMVYNYDSKWHSNAPKTRLQLCGEELVRSVHSFRSGVRDRPVIFVGYSLGGLVIQHGLLYAQRDDKFRYLLQRTVGFVALGSPFRGTKIQTLAGIAAHFMVLAGSHDGIIKDLAYENTTLRDKLQAFCQLQEVESMPRCCFFELNPTDYGRRFRLPGLFRGMVVGEESACIPGWNRFPLQTDHLKMNKFSGLDDRLFQSISEKIREMCAGSKDVMKRRETRQEQHFMVPFGRNEGFVGRESILRQLLERIPPAANKDDCQRTAVEGLGGVGKTQVALEAVYCIRETDPDCAVFWVSAVDATSFELAYRNIGQKLRVAGIEDDKADVKALVRTALSHENAGRWLLVVDNADDMELFCSGPSLAQYLPFHPSSSILFTTRNHKAAVELATAKGIIVVEEMSQEDALALFATDLKEDQLRNAQDTEHLLESLARLPLAIRQASAYMAREQVSTTEYLEFCQSSDEEMIDLLSTNFEDRHRYREILNPVAVTWLISFRQISRNPLAAVYLKFMCFMAEKDIPRALLPLAGKREAAEAIGMLKAFAFVAQREDSFDMHRLVRLAMRNWLKEGELEKCAASVLQHLAGIYPFPEHENRDLWMRYLPHALTALEFRIYSIDEGDDGSLLFNVGECLNILGKYDEAEQMQRQTLELQERVLGQEHPSTLASMNNLANVLSSLGKYDEAEQMHRQTLELKEKVLGQEHPDTLDSMNNLANVLNSLGKYNKAEQMHQQTLELKEKVLGQEHPSTLASMNNLASVLSSLGKYDEAEQMYRQTLELIEKVLGQEHPSTLTSMMNIGNVLSSLGKYEEAEQIQQQTLELTEKVLGQEHPDTLDSMNNLALVLSRLGKYDEAEQMYWQTLELREKVLGQEHPDTLDSLNALAIVLDNQGRHKEAAKNQGQALGGYRRVLGQEHPRTLESMGHLAVVLRSLEKYTEAEQMCREALKLMEKVLGDEHPTTKWCRENLAECLKAEEEASAGPS